MKSVCVEKAKEEPILDVFVITCPTCQREREREREEEEEASESERERQSAIGMSILGFQMKNEHTFVSR